MMIPVIHRPPLESALSASFRHHQFQSVPINVPLKLRDDCERRREGRLLEESDLLFPCLAAYCTFSYFLFREFQEEDDESHFARLQEAVQSHPHDPSNQFNLGLFIWNRQGVDWRAKAEHFMLAAKLNPQNGEAFRYLDDYYKDLDLPRALKCYQRAVSLIPEDSHSGETLCDLLDKQGKESLELAVCHDSSSKSSRASLTRSENLWQLIETFRFQPPLLKMTYFSIYSMRHH